jgi:hypothetical protein
MKYKTMVIHSLLFTLLLIIALSSLVGFSRTLHPLHAKSIKKIEESQHTSEVVFVGDSSLAFALDASLFSKLSNKSVSNLSLTAHGHGFSGTYNMIRHVINNNKEVKYIVIMNAPTSWDTNFLIGGYCSTLNGLDSTQALDFELIDYTDCFKFNYFNLKSIYDTYKQRAAEKKSKEEPLKTYQNGGKNLSKDSKQNFTVSQINFRIKSKELKMIDEYLKDKEIKIIYVQGSLHYQMAKEYAGIINKQHQMLNELKNITFIHQYLYPKNESMGNSVSHVDVSYKEEATAFYHSIISPYLEHIPTEIR